MKDVRGMKIILWRPQENLPLNETKVNSHKLRSKLSKILENIQLIFLRIFTFCGQTVVDLIKLPFEGYSSLLGHGEIKKLKSS